MSEGGLTSATASGDAASSPTASSTFETFASKFVKSCEKGKPLEVTLDGRKLLQPFPESDVAYLSEMENLHKLSMNACKVKSFPPLVLPSSVVELEMADNIISDLDFIKNAESSLKVLNIGNNPLPSIEALHVLKAIKNLEKLDIEGTAVMTTKPDEVEKWCWDNLKNLKVLNKRDKDGKDVVDEDEEEEFDDDDDDDDDEDDDGDDGDDDDEDDDDDEAEGEDGDIKKVDLKKFYEGGEELEDDDEDDFQPEGEDGGEGKKRKAEDDEAIDQGDVKAAKTDG